MRRSKERVLVVGGAGYIGSHVTLHLQRMGLAVAVADNLSTGRAEAVAALQQPGKREPSFFLTDVLSPARLEKTFAAFKPTTVVHLAGLKHVGQSFKDPDAYWRSNVGGLKNVLDALDAAECRRIIFSSSAAVYGEPRYLPLDEDHPTAPQSPYAETKLACEALLREWSGRSFENRQENRAVVLRYFNPVGYDPYLAFAPHIHEERAPALADAILDVACRRLLALTIFGTDYQTEDGTCLRDFVHVADVAAAHAGCIEFMGRGRDRFSIYNLGSGRGVTVLNFVRTFERISNFRVPLHFLPRRKGDIARSWADISKVRREMGWEPKLQIEEICQTIGQLCPEPLIPRSANVDCQPTIWQPWGAVNAQ
ncbi:MAG: UDP-glucose 4-epimerase GalE [Hyphomicrobiales bacterium]|nr:UDP-glucose 4-epimerase GalE [Nitratireductor sp.]MCC2096880.1 UDP-glucose 4-epimerase GalE [Hyphomicrobiales bacterium]